RHSGRDGEGARRSRLGVSSPQGDWGSMAGEKKKLNVGVVGYGFMGRTHSNAFGKVSQFFDLKREPVLKLVCGRDEEKVRAFAKNWNYESAETDWRKLVSRKDIDLIDIASP